MVEEMGFASLVLPDSQNLAPEVWGQLMLAAAAHIAGIDDEFVDWFGIAGPVARALPRFRALAALGLDFVHVISGSGGVSREVALGSLTALGRELLPALGGAAS
jgi:hypothetical protein